MAQSYVTDSGTLIIPGAYPKINVQGSNSGLATSGVLMLVGEADQGPAYSSESNLESNAFGPDQLSDVIAKYGSGPLVDAFRAGSAASADGNITGSFFRAILVKTNASVKASGSLVKFDTANFVTMSAKLEGKRGNLVTSKVETSVAEVVPTTGSFTYIPAVGTVIYDLRLNGGLNLSAGTLSANTAPGAFVSAINGIAGISATGGANRSILASVTGTITIGSISGNTAEFTRSVAWSVLPSVGDTVIIPDTSSIAGGADENVGAWVVTVQTSSVKFTATKLSDAGKTGAAAGTITGPAPLTSVPVAATDDISAFAPVIISVDAGDPTPGIGKSLEIAELATGGDLLSRMAYQLNTTPVTWISKSTGAKILSSSAEYKALLTLARPSENFSESFAIGGDIALKVSYSGTSAVMTIDKTAKTVAIAVVGGSGASIASMALADFPTINDFVTFLNSKTGYSAAVGSAIMGNQPLSALDGGAFDIASAHNAQTGRIKADGYKFAQAMANSSLASIPAAALAGIPAPSITTFFSGGAKGASTSGNVLAAIDALESVRGNFIIPLFSRDASLDIADGLTDSGSTYTIDAVNLAAKSHVIKMSTLKKRRNRQAFLSKNDTFLVQKESAAAIGVERCSMSFQDFKQLGGDGLIHQFQSWMGAALAASMQAAGFYKAIFFKNINTAGTVHAVGDYNEQNDSQLEDALQSGLLPAKRSLTGGFVWASDQTTYIKDSNFVFNSIQAMYVADIIALTCAQRMEGAFVGQSVADINAAIALSFLEAIMADFLRLKLIAASDDAPKGFKNAKVRINGGVMVVEVEIKLAGAIYFIPINFLVSQVVQTAG